MPGEQPQPDLDRDQGRRQRGGELEHERGEEGHPQRPHRRPAVRVGDRGDHLRLGPRPAEDLQGGQALDHVEEVPAEPPEQDPLAPGLGPGLQPDEYGENRNQRQRRRDHQRGDPVGERDPDQNGDRDQAGQHELR